MTFMANLAANPRGGIYGQTGELSNRDALNIVNGMRDRELQDFKDKANFMADLSMRQDRLRKIYDINDQNQAMKNQPMNEQLPQPEGVSDLSNVVTKVGNPILGQLTPEQQINASLEQAKLRQQGQLGQQALDIKDAQQRLNQEKSDQINNQKQADLQRKIDESNSKIELAQKALESKNNNLKDQLKARKDYQAAVEERHKLEMEQKQAQFDAVNKQHEETIKQMQEKIDQGKESSTTTEINPEGTKKTVTTKRGETVEVIGKDGKTYQIPKDKLDDWNANHAQEEDDTEPAQK